jgi:cell division protein ZipA
VLEVIIGTIILLLGFLGVAGYARYRSQQRSKSFETKPSRDIEPNVDNTFGQYLDEQLERQENHVLGDVETDENTFDNEPTITFSAAAMAEAEREDTATTRIHEIEQGSPDLIQQPELDLAPSSESFISPAVAVAPTPTPTPKDEIDTVAVNAVPSQTKPLNTQPAEPATRAKDKEWDIVLALTILSGENSPFIGENIRAALDFADLEPGEMQIYHRHIAEQQAQTLFSVANLLSPGTLKPEELATLKTQGLVIFMRLPSQANGLLAFDAMLDAADKMAKHLNGRLCDEKRQTLTEATLENMRSRILNFNLMQQGDDNQFKHDYSR